MIRVRATRTGIYGVRRYREGTEFTVEKESDIGKWMERLDQPQPNPPPADKRSGQRVSL